MLQFALPRHLRPRREKIFGPAPEHRLDGNAKARVWAAANAYNAANRRLGQHQGPLTWATLRVLRALLWRFHGADGGGRCFPAYEKIAAVAKCARSSVAVAVAALEDAGILTWANRIARIRRRERDLLGDMITIDHVIRTSNGYRFIDPLACEPGRKSRKSENPTQPQNQEFKNMRSAPDGAQIMQGEPSQPPPVPAETPEIAPQREHGSKAGTKLAPAEHAALIARLDSGHATKADWADYDRLLDAMLGQPAS